jgi:hypothetical protein
VVRGLQEARWLINEGLHQVIVYTDHEALLSALKNSGKGRIVGWQLKLSEFDLKIVHVKGRDNTLADGMSRLPAKWIPQGGPWKEDSCLEAMSISDAGKDYLRRKKSKEDRWREWIEDDWYGGVVWFRLFNEVQGEEKDLKIWKWWARQAANFRLVEDSGAPMLTYVEKDGRQSWCVRKSEVNRALTWAHDCHGHFAEGITIKQLKGKYYWPTRHADALRFCRACPNCQFIGPRLPSQQIKPVVRLRPMDMIGLDFLGPISPVSSSGCKYVLIAVDYFSRYAWAVPTVSSDGPTVVKFLEEIVFATFGVAKTAYTDNASYFVSGILPPFLKSKGIRQFPAPKSHPSSVGLLERYVQLVLFGLRANLLGDGVDLTTWSNFVAGVVTAMNDRTVKVHGFTPASLILGFDRVHQRSDMSVRDVLVGQHLEASMDQLLKADETLGQHLDASRDQLLRSDESPQTQEEELQPERRQAALDHMAEVEEKQTNASLKLLHYRDSAAKGLPRWDAPKEGDLVLLRRMALDGRKTDKLEARWEGPFVLGDLAYHGRTGRLFDLNTGELVKVKPGGLRDRCHLDDLRVFVPRERSDESVLREKWMDCATVGWDSRCNGGPITKN